MIIETCTAQSSILANSEWADWAWMWILQASSFISLRMKRWRSRGGSVSKTWMRGPVKERLLKGRRGRRQLWILKTNWAQQWHSSQDTSQHWINIQTWKAVWIWQAGKHIRKQINKGHQIENPHQEKFQKKDQLVASCPNSTKQSWKAKKEPDNLEDSDHHWQHNMKSWPFKKTKTKLSKQ